MHIGIEQLREGEVGGIGKYDDPMELSTSQIRTYQRCLRKWWLQYYRRLQYSDGGNKPATVGQLVHKALEHLYHPDRERFGPPLEMMATLLEEMVVANPSFEAEIRSSGELATVMFNGYLTWLEDSLADQGLEIYASEAQVKAPLGETGYTLTGRLDARAMRFGSKVVIDHKTVKALDEIPKIAQIDHQFLTYWLVEFLQDDGIPIDSVMINMFRRVDNTNQASKPPYFERYEVRYNREEIRNHWYHVVEVANQISETKRRLESGEDHQRVVPPTPMKSCAWDCSFRMICPMFDDGSDVEGFIKMQYPDEMDVGSLIGGGSG